MTIIYENILVFVLAGWIAGLGLVSIPRRERRHGYRFATKADRPRALAPLADRLLGRLALIPVVVLPLVSAAVVVLAFVHGELNDVEAGWRLVVAPGDHAHGDLLRLAR